MKRQKYRKLFYQNVTNIAHGEAAKFKAGNDKL
jgi:hypothetical protein